MVEPMRDRCRRGFTLIELVIATVIMIIISLAIYQVLHNSTVTYTDLTRLGDLQDRARMVTDRMSVELRAADTAQKFSLNKNAVSLTSISFRIPKRVDEASGAIIWSDMNDSANASKYNSASSCPATPALICYRYEVSTVDANNNAKKDEGRFVRVLVDPTTGADLAGKKQVLSDYVLPPVTGQEIFTRGADDTVKVNLTFMVSDYTGRQAKVLKRQILTSISLRNNSN